MFSRAQLLETAAASPEAVARHERQAWLDLFAADAEVHDPVGSRAHDGRRALERFYDTFIAPNEIRFHVEHDIVCGQTVVRDLVIETRMGGTPLRVNVPLFIRYEIVAEDGRPRLRRLYAHWELLPMMRGQVFGEGLGSGLLALFKLSGNMLRHQGPGGALGFARAFGGVGGRARRTAAAFFAALAAGDEASAGARLAVPCPISWAGQALGLPELARRLTGLRWEKVLAGGRQVTARLRLGEDWRAVALLDFAGDSDHISALRIFCEDA